MKFITAVSLLLFSASAFSFTTVTLNKDVPLKAQSNGSPTHWSIEGNGTKYCYVRINPTTNQGPSIIKSGTSFEVSDVIANACEWDWERVCGVTFSAVNKEKELEMSITCKDKSMLASKLTPTKVTKFTKGFLTVK